MSSRDVTLVTAFYPVKSKHSLASYLSWIKTFLTLEHPYIVLFTNSESAPILAKLRPRHLAPLRIEIVEFEDLEAWKFWGEQWKEHHALDPETSGHTPEVYAIWAQKIFFTAHVANSNPYGTTFFMWNDIGTFREGSIPETIRRTFPTHTHFPRDRLLMLAIEPLQKQDWFLQSDGIRGNFIHPAVRNAGGYFAGTKAAILRWLIAYMAMLDKFFEANRFAGKDQSVMMSTFLEDPSLALFVKCTDRNNPWFFMNRLCSTPGPAFVVDESYVPT